MDTARELAQRFGGGDDRFGYVVGPAEVGVRRMMLALEAAEPDRAVRIGQEVRTQEISIVARMRNSRRFKRV